MVDDTAIQRQFSERLTDFREKMNLSKADLARMTSLSSSAITQYEKGKKAPSIINVRRLAEALDITVNDLCGTDSEERWKESPVTALLTTLELFQFQVVEIGANTITLGLKKDSSDYSAYEVKRFFEEYKTIQAIENLNAGNKKLRHDMMNQLMASLAQKFKHLPELPPYVRPDK